MFAKVKLGTRIGAGFALLILIMVLIGGYSVVSMINISNQSEILATQFAPEVEMASSIERDVLQTMFNMRGYAYTEEQGFLDNGRSFLDKADEQIKAAEELSANSPNLVKLPGALEEIKSNANQYRALSEETVVLNAQIKGFKAQMDESAQTLMQNCTEFLLSQEEELVKEIRSGAGSDKLTERAKKISLIGDIINTTNAVRLAAWKAQTLRTPEMITEALPLFDEINSKYRALDSITRETLNVKQLKSTEESSKGYRVAMEGMVDAWNRRDAIAATRVAEANNLLAKTANLSEAGNAGTLKIADATAASLGTSRMITLVGLVMALIIGMVAAVYLTKSITGPIDLITEGAERLALGDVVLEGFDHQYAEKVKKRGDELGRVGLALSNLITYLSDRAHVSTEISKGNLEINIEPASAEDSLSHAMIDMRDQLNNLSISMKKMYAEQKAGDIEYFIDSVEFNGAYAEICDGYNAAVKMHVDAILLMLNLMQKYSDGDFADKLKPMPGKQKVANEMMDKLRDNLQRVTRDTKSLVTAALEGDLALRADISRHSGEFKEIVDGINKTLDAVIDPVREAQGVLEKMAAGDLSEKMLGEYKGDHAAIKNALNATVESLNEIMGQVQVAVEQVNSGAGQVSSASQSLSQGATEQASSLEEVSASMTEVGSQTKQNADNAIQANQLASTARNSAEQGNGHMKGMLDAMKDINNKSAEIQKIVKAIDDIAFQTNLLALNAAVEAARAGVHGKGFAVVAEEVRNLAQRSATAAKETTDLIDSNVAAVTGGTKIADQTAQALGEITDGVTKVTDLINEIASASREQTQAVDQIAEALGQIDQVTQSNTASAEESAAAAEELSGQSAHLQEMISRFQLMNEIEFAGGGNRPKTAKPKQLPGAKTEKRQKKDQGNGKHGTQVQPEDVIQLDDADFGEF